MAVIGSAIIVLVLAAPCAYALAFRMIESWRDTLFFFISTKFLPPVGISVPIYIIINNLQLLDNIVALLVMYTAMNLPIAGVAQPRRWYICSMGPIHIPATHGSGRQARDT